MIAVALMTALTAYFALRISVFPQAGTIVCERAADLCTVSGRDIFGGAWSYSFPASAMRRSRVVKAPDTRRTIGMPHWIVETAAGEVRELGPQTDRKRQLDQYAANSVALQSFIDDPNRPGFEARFDAIGGPADFFWAVMLLPLGAVLVWLIRRPARR